MSRTIDYALTHGVTVLAVTRHGKRGSDHRLVIFVVLADGVRFRIGLWNVRRDRNRHRVAALAVRVLRIFDLDALGLCEAQDYARTLPRAAAGTASVVQWSDVPGMAHQAILVRDGVTMVGKRLKLMSRSRWRTVRGRLTDPKWMPTVRLSKRGASVRVGVAHRPPTQRWRRRGGTWRMVGPVRRVAATIDHARAELAWLLTVSRPVMLLADFNAEPHIGGRWSPAWVADRAGCRIAAPKRGTHG